MQPDRNFKIHSRMREHSTSIDILLLLAVLVLISIGCFFIYDFTVVSAAVSSKHYYLMRQFTYATLGFFSLMVVSKIDYHFLSQMTVSLLIVVIIFQICAHTVGSTGFIYWQAPHLFIGTIGIHVAQITEIVALLLFAQLMSHIDLGDRNKFVLIALALLVCFLPMLLPNLKSTFVLLMVLYCLLFLEGERVILLSSFFAIAVLLLCLLLNSPQLDPMLNQRIFAWQNPFLDFSDSGLAATQSIYAIADGGVLGVGVGHGMMRYAVEDVHNIFILPAITEELGLIGASAILLIYLFLLARMFLIAVKAVDRWGFYLAAAIMARYIAVFVLYLLVRVNLIPQLSGLSLPFISYGGVSLMTECLLIGILLSIGRYQTESRRR